MDRTKILLCLCLLSAPVLSGCTASAMPIGTAKATQPPAEQVALAWADDAELAVIFGFEGTYDGSGEYGRGSSFYGYDGGDVVTDGRCEVWAYQYVSDAKDSVYTIAVSAEGEVLHAEEEVRSDEVAVGSYQVNSDEAIEIALKASSELAASQEAEGHHSMLALARDDDTDAPYWMITGGDDQGRGAIVLIDAGSGKVVFTQAFSDDWSSYGSWQ